MGFYLRKSIRLGPLRFNLSKSGVGISTGITGLRFGVGPRGNYIHMGRNGIYYRATIPSSVEPTKPRVHPPSSGNQKVPSGTHEPLEEIESAHVSQIVDTSSRELLDELNQKRSKTPLWPLVAAASIAIMGFGIFLRWPIWLLALLLLVGIIGIYVAHARDILNKTVVLLYDFDPEMETAYMELHNAASQLAHCAAVWHIEASGKVRDRKYHAGASDLVRRKNTFIRKTEPPYVKTNVETIAVGVGRQTLYFFPDRVLVYDQDGIGVVGYQTLRIRVITTRFIENEALPRDAEVVDRTWKYVNKSGGPDRRFKDNTELPVCRYEEISLSSSTGLHEVLQVSRCGFGNNLAEAISLLGKKIAEEIRYSAPRVQRRSESEAGPR